MFLMQHFVVTAPHNTICGHYKCQRIVATDDLNIVRYMGKIYHHTCFNGQIMSKAKASNRTEVACQMPVDRFNTVSC